MGMFVSDFIPYNVTGRVVNLDTEYMYRWDLYDIAEKLENPNVE